MRRRAEGRSCRNHLSIHVHTAMRHGACYSVCGVFVWWICLPSQQYSRCPCSSEWQRPLDFSRSSFMP